MDERYYSEHPHGPLPERSRSTIRLASSRASGSRPATYPQPQQQPHHRPAPRNDRERYAAARPRSQHASNPRPQGRPQHRPRSSSVIGQPLRRDPVGGRAYGHRNGRPLSRNRDRARTAPMQRRSRAPRVIALAVVFLFLGCIFRAIPAGLPMDVETPQLDMELLSPGYLPISTPASEWRRGTLPHLYQSDPAWAQQPYGGGTVYANACGPTALTMVYVYSTGNRDMTPATMAAWADAHGYAPTGATEWSFMTKGAAAFGLNSRMVDTQRSTIEQALKAGKPVIALMDPGDFTNVGHFIVLTGITENGMITVNDPFSATRSARVWPIATVCAQSEYSWVFDAVS